MQKLPIKSEKGIINLGNFENIIKIKDESISFNKKSNLNLCDTGLWLQVGETKYYFKAVKDMFSTLNDLLGVKITEYFGLPSVRYKIAKGLYKGQEVYGLLSKYERNPEYNYQNLESIVYSEESDFETPFSIKNLSFLHALEETYKGSPLVNQLKTLIIRDLVTVENDRNMGEIQTRQKDGIIEIDKIFDYEKEWNLLGEDSYELSIKEEDILLRYKICGLLSLTENEYPYLKKDPVFQAALNKFLELDIVSLLEQVDLESPILIVKEDYDFYSLYTETVKSKLKKEKII